MGSRLNPGSCSGHTGYLIAASEVKRKMCGSITSVSMCICVFCSLFFKNLLGARCI
jgi:hypothetical protein